jgi:hypothetical protein
LASVKHDHGDVTDSMEDGTDSMEDVTDSMETAHSNIMKVAIIHKREASIPR